MQSMSDNVGWDEADEEQNQPSSSSTHPGKFKQDSGMNIPSSLSRTQ